MAYLPISEITAGLEARLRRVRLFAFDLDGTLLTDNKQVTPRTRAAIEALRAQNIEAVPTTGRTWQGVCEDLIGMSGFHYLVAGCGACVRDLYEQRFLVHNTLEPELAISLIRACAQPNTIVYLNMDDEEGTRMATCPTPEFYNYMRGQDAFWDKPLMTLDEMQAAILVIGTDVVKVGVRFLPPWDYDDFHAIGRSFGITSNAAAAHNVEFNAPNTKKSAGIAAIAHELGFSMDEVCTIGDSENDVDMLQDAGIGVAMGNAFIEAREAADVVLELTNEQDGLADFVERFLLA